MAHILRLLGTGANKKTILPFRGRSILNALSFEKMYSYLHPEKFHLLVESKFYRKSISFFFEIVLQWSLSVYSFSKRKFEWYVLAVSSNMGRLNFVRIFACIFSRIGNNTKVGSCLTCIETIEMPRLYQDTVK